MKHTAIKTAFGLALSGALGSVMLASPAQALDLTPISSANAAVNADLVSQYGDPRWRDRRYDPRFDDRYGGRENRYDRRWDDRDRYDDDRRYDPRNDDPYYRDQRDYRDQRAFDRRDQRRQCRKNDGTTGTIIGGAIGALLGREVDTRGDRTLGTVLGAAGGALLGREIEKGRCR
jgi:hypothetical protein